MPVSTTAVVLSLLLAALSLFAGGTKVLLKGAPPENLRGHGFDDLRIRLLGAAEVAAAAGLVIGFWYPPLGLAAAIGMTLLLIGAVGYHVRWGDFADWATARSNALAAVVGLVLAAATVVAIARTGI